jgi:cellulose synthase/poly-beta-1,6-N-acetylglucosamine synthase-like glycosyltransferase
VLIAARNEEKNIGQCLKSVLAQDYPDDMYEVIVADDRSTDKTTEIVEKYCSQHPNLRLVRVEDSDNVIPKKTALIEGLKISKGEIIVSTDADCVQTETWLSSINACFSDEVGMVIGHTGYTKPDTLWKGIDAIDYLSQRALGVAFVGVGSAYTCTASNFAYRREVYERNREEFSQLKVRPAEDNYFLNRVHKKSDYTFCVPTSQDSIVTTDGASGFSQFINQRFRWGAYGGNIVTLGVKLFFIPMLLYYCVIWVSLISGLFGMEIFSILILSLISKMIVDFLFMLKATTLYQCRYLLKYFIPISIFHLILVPVIVLKGNLFAFKWKGRKYTKNLEIKK